MLIQTTKPTLPALPDPKPGAPAKSALHRVHVRTERVEVLAELLEGEVTDELQAELEAFEAERDTAIEELADYARYCEHVDAACAAEIARLVEVRSRQSSRLAWAEERLAALVTSATAGTRRRSVTVGETRVRVSLRQGRERVVLDAGLDAGELPPHCQRWTEPVPAQVTADKKAIADALRRGELIEGAELKRGPSTIKIG